MVWNPSPEVAVAREEWRFTAEPSARLKPGGGPIKVRVTIEAE